MRYCPILFYFPLREDDFVDKEEDQHQNVTVEHRGSDVIDKVRHQQARNRRSHAVDEVNEAGDQTECQHQAICLARSTLPRNIKLRWMGKFKRQIHRKKNSWILHLLSSHGGLFVLPCCLPEPDIVHQFIAVALDTLLAFVGTPHLDAVLDKPFQYKWCFTLDAPQPVKHIHKKDIEVTLVRLTAQFLNHVPLIGRNFGT